MTDSDREYLRAFREERLRNTRQLNVFRVGGLTMFLALQLIYAAALPGWTGASGFLAAYWALGLCVYLLARRFWPGPPPLPGARPDCSTPWCRPGPISMTWQPGGGHTS